MRTIIILAFVLIGMIGHAQQEIPVDSMKVGDTIKFKRECKDILDIYNESWTFPKNSSFVITQIYRDNYGNIDYFKILSHEGKEIFIGMDGSGIEWDIYKKRITVCR